MHVKLVTVVMVDILVLPFTSSTSSEVADCEYESDAVDDSSHSSSWGDDESGMIPPPWLISLVLFPFFVVDY
jgi:hypothetical protein